MKKITKDEFARLIFQPRGKEIDSTVKEVLGLKLNEGFIVSFIEAEKTIGEMQKLLGSHGAKSIMTDYEDGVVSALSFIINLNGNDIAFRLPCDWRPVLTILENDRKVPNNLKHQFQAVRVAWRIVLAWVEAQMALIDTRMVSTVEVFLPYAVAKNGMTLGQHILSNPQFLLGSPSPDGGTE